MKTLKQLLKEAGGTSQWAPKVPGKTTGTPGGQGNWSVSGPDLAKNWAQDPEYKKKLATHQKSGYTDLIKSMTGHIEQAFLAVPEKEIDAFARDLETMIGATVMRVKRKHQKDRDATTKINAEPDEQDGTDTNPGRSNKDKE